MIFTGLYRLRSEEVVELVAIWLFVGPLPYSVEHVPVNLKALVTECGMVEDSNDVTHYLYYRDSRIFPGIENSSAKF